ncbi:MAG: tetratricopeptide repeat protein, partial [Bacteroidota bacterium]
IIYDIRGNYGESLNHYLNAMKICEQHDYITGLSGCYLNIGILYDNQGKYEKALEYYIKASAIYDKFGDLSGMSNAFNNIGCIYEEYEDLDKALEYFLKSAEICSRLKNASDMALSYRNLGGIYQKKGEFGKALEYLQKSFDIRESMGDKSGIADSYVSLGLYYLDMNNTAEAYNCFNKSLSIGMEIREPRILREGYYWLSEASRAMGDYPKAYDYYVRFKEISDSILNSETVSEITRMEMQYKIRKKEEIQQLEQEKKDIEHREEIKRQQLQKYFLFSGLALTLLLVFFAFRAYRIKRKANFLLAERNHEILQQKEEIEAQRDEIEAQRDEIEAQRDLVIKQNEQISQQNKNITDSIRYARRIQAAVLPEQELPVGYISEHFIFFKPRDIVSGDFYWFGETGGRLIVVAADCTGHGVPGAFMSMLGITFLNEIVLKEGIYDPPGILNRLRKEVIKALHQQGEDNEHAETALTSAGSMKDGMDIACCAIDRENKCIYSGANNPLYLVRNSELTEYRADRMPISIYVNMESFTPAEIQLEKGDCLYLFSDGFADQFGGERGRKFKYQSFKELLLSVSALEMKQQQCVIEDTFRKWKEGYEQVDDVVVVGVKI